MSFHEPDEATDYPLILDFLWPQYPDRMPSRAQTPDIVKAGPVVEVLSSRAEGKQTIMKKEEIAHIPISPSDQQNIYAVRDRISSQDATDDEFDTALHPHPLPLGSIQGQSIPMDKQLSSRSPSPLVKRSRSSSLIVTSPSTTLTVFTGTPVEIQVEKEVMGRSKRKRNAVGRNSEQRRTQNMFAQKKYRDKRLHAAELSIVQFQVALDRLSRETPEDCLDRIQYFMNEYRLDMEALDPILLAKQDKEVRSQNF